MDLLYMSETINYYSVRGPIYDRYDNWEQKPKERGRVNKDTRENALPDCNNNLYFNKSMSKPKPQKTTSKSNNCQLCREKQKRSLSNYIRSKSIECSIKGGIPEEVEENHT